MNSLSMFRLLVAGLCLLVPSIQGFTKQYTIANEVDKYVQEQYFLGSIVLAKGDSILYQNHSGIADTKTNRENNDQSIYEIASIAKSFTAFLILQLVQEGKLSLTDSLGTFKTLQLKEHFAPITVHQLLNHTSGVIDHDHINHFFDSIAKRDQPRSSIIALINRSELLFEPGTNFRYSNFGYNILAFLIEDITKENFNDCLASRIFNPMALRAYRKANSTAKNPLESKPYVYNIFGHIDNAELYDHSVDIGAGGIYMTALELIKWSNALEPGQYLKQHLVDKMFDMNRHNWGYGWEKRSVNIDSNSVDYFSHGALANGYWGLLSKFENYTISIVSNLRPNDIILNNVRPIPIRFVNNNIIRILNGYPPIEFNPSMAKFFAKEIDTNNLETAILKFRRLSDHEKYKYDDGEFLVLGYELMERGKHEKGLEIFNHMLMNTEDYALVYECLGDAYYDYINDKKKALENYSISQSYNDSNGYVNNRVKSLNKILDKKE